MWMRQIPIIGLSEALDGGLGSRQAVARQIDRTCREIGFFTIAGHGVPVTVMNALRSKAHAFFALPLEEKRKAVHPVAGTPRGYRAQGIEALGQANATAAPGSANSIANVVEFAVLGNSLKLALVMIANVPRLPISNFIRS